MPAYQGTYYVKQLTFTDSAGDAVDISSYEFEMDIRDQADDSASLVTLTTANGGLVVTDGPAGELEIRITAVNTLLLPVGKMVFDILRTDSSPGPTWMVGGSFKVKQPITR
jgi:hypothetical protein